MLSDQQRDRLKAEVEQALERHNLKVNGASMRFGIDRQALTRFKAGIPMSLPLVEHWARSIREDVRHWREVAGYDPLEPSPAERLGVELDKLRREFETDELVVKGFSGLTTLTHADVDVIIGRIRARLEEDRG